MDIARSRAVPAAFVDARGRLQLFVTGGTRPAIGSAASVPPSLVRLEVAGDGGAPYLRIGAREASTPLRNPGSPVVTSDGARAPIVWVLDENALRSASLGGDAPPRPRLHAFDGATLERLWSSGEGVLHASGKYNAPAFGGGLVFVGTDRLQAFGPGGSNVPSPAAPPPAAATVAIATPAGARPTAPAVTRVAAAVLYGQRCAACHDHPVGNIPPRAQLAARPRSRIVHALTEGIMKQHAAGLGPGDIQALAEYLHP